MAGSPQHQARRAPLCSRLRRQHQEFRGKQPGESALTRVWQPNPIGILSSLVAFIGLLILLYPDAASWFSQYSQSTIIASSVSANASGPTAEDLNDLKRAQRYNEALNVGAVLEANTNVPIGRGENSDTSLRYEDLLKLTATGVMGRVQIPSIDVDLPIYHGTADKTLLLGAGHLEGTSLPIGGPNTRTVITAHRGLANAKMFTDLDQLVVGDSFSISAGGQTLSYKVSEKKVVEPEETESLRTERGRDLATLVTCTPLGINSHRILVTGERIIPTPSDDIKRAGRPSELPRFPWWAVWLGLGTLIIVFYAIWSNYGYGDRDTEDEAGEE